MSAKLWPPPSTKKWTKIYLVYIYVPSYLGKPKKICFFFNNDSDIKQCLTTVFFLIFIFKEEEEEEEEEEDEEFDKSTQAIQS